MRFNLNYKITLIFGIIFAVFLTGIYLYLDANLKENTYQRIRSNLLRETLLAESIFEEDTFLDMHTTPLDRIADRIGRDLDLRVTVISPEGTVLGDSDLGEEELLTVENHLYRPEVQEALSSGVGESVRFSTTVQKNMLYIARLLDGAKFKGFIRLSMPLSEIDEISGHLKKILVLALLFAFVLMLPIGLMASFLISKPLREMSSAARDIAGGNFSRKVLVTTRDEIGDLAGSLNHMSEQVQSRIEEVMTGKSRFEAVLLSMFDGLMVIEPRSSIMFMNPRLMDAMKIKEDPAGKTPLEVLRNVEVQELVDAVIGPEAGVETREITVHLPEEKIFSVHAASIVRDDKVEGGVLVFHDITKLRHLEKIRRDFVANASHELRTPISNIKGYTETLREGALKDEKNAEEFINIIHSNADRLANLVDDLLDLSRIESGKIGPEKEACAIRPIIERAVGDLEAKADTRGIDLRVDLSEDLPDVKADAGAIYQVLFNLVDNAINYNSDSGSVTITAQEEGAFIRVGVTDTGIGIPPEDIPRIFERFYRVDKARSREAGGTGLGLSIVKHIVQEHGGDVSVTSESGKGSVFSFTIPRV